MVYRITVSKDFMLWQNLLPHDLSLLAFDILFYI